MCVHQFLEKSNQNYHKYKIGLSVHHSQEIAIFQSFSRLHSNKMFAIFVKSKFALLSELLPGNESHTGVAVVWLQLGMISNFATGSLKFPFLTLLSNLI